VTAPPPERGMSARSNALCSARRASAVARADAAASRARREPARLRGAERGLAIEGAERPRARATAASRPSDAKDVDAHVNARDIARDDVSPTRAA
jgi:hypothetical protein